MSLFRTTGRCLAAGLMFWALLPAADEVPAPPAPPAPADPAPPVAPPTPPAEKPAAEAPPPIPADGVLLRYKYIRGQTLKLTGAIKIVQTYQQSDQEKPVSRDAAIDVEGEMTFLQITADGRQAVAEARVKSTTAGETTFTKSMQRIDDRGQVLSDQSNLPPPRPDTDPAVVSPAGAQTPPSAAAPAAGADTPPVAPATPALPAPAVPVTPAAPGAAATPAPRPNRGGSGGGSDGADGPRGAEAKPADSAPLQATRMVFPEGKVKVGDSWTRESFHIQTGAAGAPKMKDLLTVTVKEIRPQANHNIVVLAYTLHSTPVETLANLNGSATRAKGESEFDLEAGAILKTTLHSDTAAEAVTDGVKSTLKILADATYTITVNAGGAATGVPAVGGRGSRGSRGGRSSGN